LKPQHIKQILYPALLLFLITGFFPACKKQDIIHHHVISPQDSSHLDSIAKIDSLPSFNSPTGVAVDAAGNIFVADYGNNLIREITPGGIVSTFAGSGFAGRNDATGLLASFAQPTGIAIDKLGNLFVADAGNGRIREITSAGVVTTVAGTDSTGAINGADTSATFFDPLGVAVSGSGNVYVADAGNNLIRLISGGSVSTFAGILNTGTSTTLSPFNNPTGVALDALGNVFVANYLDNNIMKVTPAGLVSIYAGSPTGDSGANNGPAANATFFYPNNVAVDKDNNVYVSDGVNNMIRKITPDGTVSTLAGSGATGAIDSTGVNASFNGPSGLAVDAAGNVYVADSNNNLIRKITPAGVVTTVAGSGIQGAKNGTAIARRNRKPLKLVAKGRLNIIYRKK